MTQWTVGERSGEVKTTTNRKKLAFRPAYSVTKDTPKNQVAPSNSFNEMRQRLLDIGEMESK